MKRVIACDLDGTLAEYHGWKGIGDIGPVVPAIKDKLLAALEGGAEVAIFTARANDGEVAIQHVKSWLKENGMPDMTVTCTKHKKFTEFWDDRAVHVERNTGKIGGPSAVRKILNASADIYDDRNDEYRDAYKRVHAQVMSALFPDGLTLKGRDSFIRFCLVNAVIGKIARYTTVFNEGGHEDSALDGIAYLAMLKEIDDEISKC